MDRSDNLNKMQLTNCCFLFKIQRPDADYLRMALIDKYIANAGNKPYYRKFEKRKRK